MATPPPTPRFVERFSEALESLGGRRIERGILIAVSGGPDSTALLRLFQAWRDLRERSSPPPRLLAGHIHHGRRGPDADADAAFAAALAASAGIEILCERVNVPELARAEGRSFESTARTVRYRALERWARERGLGVVAVGHHAGDQQETVLLRIARGAGIRGLAGIPRRRFLDAEGSPGGPLLIRPLLGWARAEILDYLRAIDQDFREDLTNRDRSIPRNAVRLEILPRLEALVHPGAGSAIERLAGIARQAAADQRRLARGEWGRVRRPEADGPGCLAFCLAELRSLPGSLRDEILRRALRLAGRRTGREPPPFHARAALEACRRLEQAGTAADAIPLGRGWVLGIEGGILRVRAPGGDPAPLPAAASPAALLAIPGEASWEGWRIRAELLDMPPAIGGGDRLSEVIDHARLPGPLVVRGRRRGEKFHPLGAPGAKRLKEFLRECGVPPAARDRIPLVASGEELVWVVGRRISEAFRITPATRSWARLTAAPPP